MDAFVKDNHWEMCVHVVHDASRNCNKQHFNIKENERDYHFK